MRESSFIKKALSYLLDLIYPPRCVFCRRLLNDSERGVCAACRKSVQIAAGHENRRDIKGIEMCVSPLRYEAEVRQSLLRYKFSGLSGYCETYSEFMNRAVSESGISYDFITWVPLSRKRLRKRGYDQAFLLAECLSKITGKPCVRTLNKTVNNKPQSSTGNAKERRANAADVYSAADASCVAGKTVLLVDDIVTTGSTLEECARILHEAGCDRVYAATVASRR